VAGALFGFVKGGEMTQYIRTIVILVAIGVAAYFVIQWGGGWEVLKSNPQTWVNELIHTVEGWFFR
jgi:hypothetical protein